MRIAFLGDIHGNLAALDAVLEHLARQSVDRVLHTGDVVGYCVDFEAVVDRLKRHSVDGVVGNHELMLLGRLDDSRASSSARTAILWARRVLTERTRDYLESLQEHIVEPEFVMFHATPASIVKSVKTVANATRVFEDLSSWGEPKIAVHGHTHIQRVFEHSGSGIQAYQYRGNEQVRMRPDSRYLVCPGSVGVSRDSDRRAAYMILDASGVLEFYRVPYSWRTTRRRNREAGLSTALFVSPVGKLKNRLLQISGGRIAIPW